jgi:pimeloyl-ACP methyl ester carboxylesterase
MRSAFFVALIFVAPVAFAQIEWQPYSVRTFDGRELAVELGTLAVPEHRRAPNTRWIRVAALRLRARTNSGAPPIVFLTGGPAVPATTLARVPVYFDLFDSLRDAGDVLLLDQRGSGMSLPSLACPEAPIDQDFVSSDATLRHALAARVSQCAGFFRLNGVDLGGYTTGEIAADVNGIRNAMHSRTVKLLAFSYGSEVAFELLRRWPKTIDRVVFASTRAPDTLLKSPAVWDRQLESVVTPVRDVVQQFDTNPLQLGSFRAGGIAILSVLRNDLPDGRAHAKIPGFIRELRAGETKALTTRIEQLHNALRTSFSIMSLAVDCSSGWSDARFERTQREARDAIMRNVNLQWDPEVCGAVVPERHFPAPMVRVSVPALFITGSRDPNAPAEQTEAIRRRWFARGEQKIIDGAAHETLPIPVVQKMVVEFLRRQ